MKPISYHIDGSDRIVHVDGPWQQFADDNQAPELKLDAVVGKRIWDFFAGSETRSLFDQMFQHVRRVRSEVKFPFRCDAPELERAMQLVVRPLPGEQLRVESHQLRTCEHHAPWLERAKGDHRGREVEICSLCRRVNVEGKWLEASEALTQAALFLQSRRPTLRERVCEECARIEGGWRYILTAPDHPWDNLPLVVFLHGGAQERWLMRLEAPPRLAGNDQRRNFVLVSPICRGRYWDEETVEDIVREVLDSGGIDRTRICLTGISNGATAAWELICRDGTPFSRALPLAGMLGIEVAARVKPIPTWVFHGARDAVIPLPAVEPAYRALTKHNPRARFDVVENAEHDVWSRAYHTPGVWSWMLSETPGTGTTSA